MDEHILRGIGFGTASGVITTLGLIFGLEATTGSKFVIIGGIVSIAIADALSDAMGIHISEEATSNNHRQIWETTAATFLFKFFVALTFLIPVLLMELKTAILVDLVWGISILIGLSFKLAKMKDENPWASVFEHTSIAIAVVLITKVVGSFIKSQFGL